MTTEYDVIIRDGNVVDGTGWPVYKGSVGIREDRIQAIGAVEGTATREIDGRGLVISPGFIDTHSHADLSLLQYPLVENFIMQGVTTFLGGNCGSTLAPLSDPRHPPQYVEGRIKRGKGGVTVDWKTFGEWLDRIEAMGISVNYVPLVGHNTIRTLVMGEEFKREATATEIEEMKAYVEEAMNSGAFGLSSGFDPGPGEYATTSEAIELAKVAQKYDGLYSPHTRFHQDSWVTDDPEEHGYGLMHTHRGEIIVGRYHGLLEAVEIAKQANIRLLIAHITPAYIIPQPQPKLLQEAAARSTLVEVVDKPREKGVDVYYNVIAFTPSVGRQVSIAKSFLGPRLALPAWMRELTIEEFAAELKTTTFREKVKRVFYSGRIKFYMVHPLINPYWMDCFTVVRSKNKEYERKTIGEIARQKGPTNILDTVYNVSIETIFDILIEDPNATWAVSLDVRENTGALPVFLQHPAGMPCADTFSLPAKPENFAAWDSPLKPIAYGLFPHYIHAFVKQQNTLSLEEAIRKITSLPARVLGLKDRGTISQGAYADIVVFDANRLKMKGDFAEAERPPAGIEFVLVNGKVAYENMAHTGAKAGRVLRHQ